MIKNRTVYIAMIAGLLFGIAGCLEKEYYPDLELTSHGQAFDFPFGLYKLHLTLVDAGSQDPLPGLLVQLSKNTFSQRGATEPVEQVTDSLGLVHIAITASPPVPQEFVLSFSDTTQRRLFVQESIVIFFRDPVFKYVPRDAAVWGKLYQGTAEMTLTHELTQTFYE
ncbi:MAG: hypothetical protein FWD56_00775 [Bacteroidales bacterium]|nr:hypothetical protein [Bacteroidales bacterium]